MLAAVVVVVMVHLISNFERFTSTFALSHTESGSIHIGRAVEDAGVCFMEFGPWGRGGKCVSIERWKGKRACTSNLSR